MIGRWTTALAVALGLQSAAFAADTIKLGVVNIDSGPFAVSGAFVNDGATFAVEQLNASGGALAIESKMPGLNALFIDDTAASNDLTGKNCTANYFRVGITDGMQVKTYTELAERSGIKSWDLMMADIAVGHDSAKLFAAASEANGATVNKTLFAPITASDLGSHIAQLVERPAEGLFMYYPSSGGIALIKQQAPFKLIEKYKTVLSSSMVNKILSGAHGGASVGLWSAQSYYWTLPGDLNTNFVKAFEARFKRQPTYIDADAYLSFKLVHQAILKADSAEVGAVRAALAGLKLKTIVGDVEMRAADHQLLRPLMVVQAMAAGDGKGEITLRSVLPRAEVEPAISPECKM